jgi:tRNA-specific 2-thiouridylase
MSRGVVAVGLSGGVDSSAAVALLLDAGYECVGVTMRHLPPEAANSCCSLEAVVDARRVAKKLGIPHYLVDVEEAFRQHVMDPFEEAYLAGTTPNPCAACNRFIKFGALWEWAKDQGADYLATGHYARIVERPDGVRELWRGKDRGKDQSYILYSLGQDDLAHILFPLGDLTKAEVRALAADRGLVTAGKPDSQELCFVAGNDYRQYLKAERPDAVRPGRIVDTAGRTVGRHEGVAFYTVGQRRGLGLSAPIPLYVVAVHAAANEVVVGSREEAMAEAITVADVRGPLPMGASARRAEIQVRAHGAVKAGIWTAVGAEMARVRFDQPEWGVTPGQIAVAYDGDRLLAGGRIVETLAAAS